MPLTHDEVFDALLALEPIFHHEAVGATRETFERMTTPDFWAVGVTGEVHQREAVIADLVERWSAQHDDPWDLDDFAVRQLGIITWLATYELTQGDQMSRRSTIWTHVGGDWIAVYHQGTPVTG